MIINYAELIHNNIVCLGYMSVVICRKNEMITIRPCPSIPSNSVEVFDSDSAKFSSVNYVDSASPRDRDFGGISNGHRFLN